MPCVTQKIHSKELLAIYKAFLEFVHILWETIKPTAVLTWRISHTLHSNESTSPVALECLWSCNAMQFQNGAYHSLSQHSSWLSLQTLASSYGEETSQNPGRHTINTHWDGDIFFGCRWWRTILQLKGQTRQDAKEWGANEETIVGNTTSHSKIGIKTNALVEQDVDLFWKILNSKYLANHMTEC